MEKDTRSKLVVWISAVLVMGTAVGVYRRSIRNVEPAEQTAAGGNEIPPKKITQREPNAGGGAHKPVSGESIESFTKRWLECIATRDLEGLKVVEGLIQANPDAHVRWLGEVLSNEQADDASSKPREFAAGLLARIGTPEAVSALFGAYQRRNVTRSEAENVLRAFDYVTNAQAGSTLVEFAVRSLDSAPYSALVNAAGRCADNTLIATLTSTLLNPETPRVQFIAESVLQKVPPELLAEQFQQMIDYATNASSLSLFATKLGDDGSDRSIVALRNALLTAPQARRKILLDGLFRIHSKDALPTLERIALEDSDPDVRKTCIYALGNYAADVTSPILQRLYGDARTISVRKDIEFVYGLLQKQRDQADRKLQ